MFLANCWEESKVLINKVISKKSKYIEIFKKIIFTRKTLTHFHDERQQQPDQIEMPSGSHPNNNNNNNNNNSNNNNNNNK